MERVTGIEPVSSAWKAEVISRYTIPAIYKLLYNEIMNKKFLGSIKLLIITLLSVNIIPLFSKENEDAIYVNNELKKISDPYFLDLLKKTENSTPKQMSPKLVRFLKDRKLVPAWNHIMQNVQLDRNDKNYIYVLERIKKQEANTSTKRFGEMAWVRRYLAEAYFQAKEFGKAEDIYKQIIHAEKMETRTSANAFDVLSTLACILGESEKSKPYQLLALKQYYTLREIQNNQLILNDLNRMILVFKEERSDLEFCKMKTEKLEQMGFL